MYTKKLDQLIDNLKKLPGISTRGAEKIAFHLLYQDPINIDLLVKSIYDLQTKSQFCNQCNFLVDQSDSDLCQHCINPQRNHQKICLVPSLFEAFKIENAKIYDGLYYVFNGELSLKNNQNLTTLDLDRLIHWLKQMPDKATTEIIIATNPTTDGQFTAKKLAELICGIDPQIKIFRLGFGLPYNSQINYVDDISLEQSLTHKQEIRIAEKKDPFQH
ncbi:recombination protein RecR [Mycoplasmoides fastidiosum]|uniref:Recombination protein RecR n=1 Tax=Mycoplasmoides fastidiosum TaxID=92758 RepID=A0ABU0M049_9BACT|nr:toprim domain-containing protein [Mycoplasmoides fastidiosum]MDQ0514319.1 recombination protein RecR [Mycoplasmoides fastidiosum]UUD38078.1 toprim domain-containing protein [Mycoplasmoides fastidiosum]